MASKSKKSEPRERHRLPPEQQRELNKDGRCRRILCDILRLRVFAYIARQPAPFMFILSLFLISITLPLVGLYISRVDGLPDLDAMQNWNAYIGRLGRKDFCFNINKTEMSRIQLRDVLNLSSMNGGERHTVGVMINFTLDKDVLTSAPENTFLYGTFTGNDFTTQIKDSSGKRIDDKIHIHLLLDVSTTTCNITQGESTQCKVETCVLITAPGDAIPTRLPQVHHNATFKNKVYGSDINRRPKECSFCNGTDDRDLLKADHCPSRQYPSMMVYYNISAPATVRNVTLCSKTKDTFDGLYLPAVHRGASKGHGIIRINLSKEDQQTAANHMYIAALAVAALAVAFAISIIFTDRPPQPKSSQE